MLQQQLHDGAAAVMRRFVQGRGTSEPLKAQDEVNSQATGHLMHPPVVGALLLHACWVPAQEVPHRARKASRRRVDHVFASPAPSVRPRSEGPALLCLFGVGLAETIRIDEMDHIHH